MPGAGPREPTAAALATQEQLPDQEWECFLRTAI